MKSSFNSSIAVVKNFIKYKNNGYILLQYDKKHHYCKKKKYFSTAIIKCEILNNYKITITEMQLKII